MSFVEQIKALLDNYPRFPNDVPLINPMLQQYEDWIKQVKKDVLAIIEPLMAHLQTLPPCWVYGQHPCELTLKKWKEELDKHKGVKK